MNNAIDAFMPTITTDFQRLFSLTADMLHYNSPLTAFNKDWSIELENRSNVFLIRNVPHIFTNGTCNCIVSSTCQEPLRIGPLDLILPGLVVGCMPIHGLSMSTLECFFSLNCINTIITYLDYYIQMDGSPPVNFTPSTILSLNVPPLDSTRLVQSSITTPIGTLINALLIEQWTRTISYEKYFTACAPTSCIYETTEKNGVFYVGTTVLAFYGGLTIGLRFIIWHISVLYQMVKGWINRRRAIIYP